MAIPRSCPSWTCHEQHGPVGTLSAAAIVPANWAPYRPPSGPADLVRSERPGRPIRGRNRVLRQKLALNPTKGVRGSRSDDVGPRTGRVTQGQFFAIRGVEKNLPSVFVPVVQLPKGTKQKVSFFRGSRRRVWCSNGSAAEAVSWRPGGVGTWPTLAELAASGVAYCPRVLKSRT